MRVVALRLGGDRRVVKDEVSLLSRLETDVTYTQLKLTLVLGGAYKSLWRGHFEAAILGRALLGGPPCVEPRCELLCWSVS